MRGRLYIAGPMAGLPDLNRPRFREAAAAVAASGVFAVNPHDIPPWEHPGPCPASYAISDSGHSAACHLRTCLAIVLSCDAVLLIEGWQNSRGAQIERAVARDVGIPTFTQLAEAASALRAPAS
jgi:Domain of unknown function (DUF4406)